MSIKFLCGFEYRVREDDGYAFAGGFNFWASSTNVPTASKGARSMNHNISIAGNYTSPCTSNVSESWIGSQVLPNVTGSQILVGLSEGVSTRYIDAGVDGGNWAIHVNGTSKASIPGVPLGQWSRIHTHIEGLAAGDVISLYKDGDLSTALVQYTLTSGDVSGWPSALTHSHIYINNQAFIDDVWIMDPSDGTGVTDPQETVSFSVELLKPNADGADFTFATGSFADVDEIPFNLTDKITADAVGQIADLSLESATAAQVIGAIKVTQRTQRTGTVAGSQAEISIDDGVNNNAIETVGVPGDGYIRTYTAEAADGTSLDVTKLNASTIQIKTVT